MIAHDKALHVIAGVVVFAVFQFVSPLVGLLMATTAGVVKELYDSTGKGTVDVMDVVYTVAGGLLGFVCTL